MPVFKQGDHVIYQENYLKPQFKATVVRQFKVLGYYEYIVKLDHNGSSQRCSSLNLMLDDGTFDLENNLDMEIDLANLEEKDDEKKVEDELKKNRFPSVSDEEANLLIASRLSKGTMKQTHYAVKILKG